MWMVIQYFYVFNEALRGQVVQGRRVGRPNASSAVVDQRASSVSRSVHLFVKMSGSPRRPAAARVRLASHAGVSSPRVGPRAAMVATSRVMSTNRFRTI